MSTFQKVTKMSTAPLAAAAITSTTASLVGRPTTSRTTHQLANSTQQQLHTLIKQYTTTATTSGTSRYGLQKNRYSMAYNATNNSYMQILIRRNLTSAKPSTPKQQAVSSPAAAAPPPPHSSSSSSGSKNVSFLEWYEGHLQSKPIQTKMVTGSILWGLGDVVAQIVPQVFFDDEDNNDKESKEVKQQRQTANELVYDYPRTARAMLFGFGIHAPLSHVHFNFLEWMTIKGGFAGLSIPVFKAFMEQFVYWSWFSNTLYHGAMGAMQGMSSQQIYDRIADVLWETQKAQWVFWIPVQLLNFRFVPVRHQLNVVLLTSVVWTALLSAWYPPEDDENETKAIEKDGTSKKE